MATLRICGVQMEVKATKSENMPRVLNLIERSDCDLILFPEMSLTGYNNDFSTSKTEAAWEEIAIKCRQSYTGAIIGTGARSNGHTYIQSRIYSDEGDLIGTHEKLVPTEAERKWCRPGEELRTFEFKGITFGCLICNDFWVTPGTGPYADRRLSHKLGKAGAQVIFLSVNSGTDQFYSGWHEENLKLRARASNCYIVTANAAYPDSDNNCPTGVMSPQGEWLTKVPQSGERVMSFDLELD